MMQFNKFQALLREDYDFEILYKDESKFMKFLSKILFFNKTFMTMYVTTIGNKVYFPSRQWMIKHEHEAMSVLAHEIVHIEQSKKFKMAPFAFLYVFPQSLALLSVLAVLGFFNPAFLWCLLFLVCAAPFPAPFRKKFEYEGYVMTLFMYDVQLKNRGFDEAQRMKRLRKLAGFIKSKIFRTSAYYFMWPLKLPISFDKVIEDIRSGVISDTSEMYDRMQRSYMQAVSAYEL